MLYNVMNLMCFVAFWIKFWKMLFDKKKKKLCKQFLNFCIWIATTILGTQNTCYLAITFCIRNTMISRRIIFDIWWTIKMIAIRKGIYIYGAYRKTFLMTNKILFFAFFLNIFSIKNKVNYKIFSAIVFYDYHIKMLSITLTEL